MAQTLLTPDEPPPGGLKLARKLGQWTYIDVETDAGTERLEIRVDEVDPSTGYHRLHIRGDRELFTVIREEQEATDD